MLFFLAPVLGASLAHAARPSSLALVTAAVSTDPTSEQDAPSAPPPDPASAGAPSASASGPSEPTTGADLPAPAVAPTPQDFPGLMNPSIAVNGLFLAGVQTRDGTLTGPAGADEPLPGEGETFGTGLSAQEFEVQFKAAVDPYLDANVVLAVPGFEGIEIEEGYVTLRTLPGVLVRAGKIKEAFGRENLTHTHALLTVDRALVSQAVFGEEGLNDVGIDAQFLLPAPWFSELTLGVDAGSNEVVLGSGAPGGVGTMAHWRNLVDLGDTTTLELGVSGLTGLAAAGGRSVVGGIDLTLKGHGTGARQFQRIVWQNELLVAQRRDAGTTTTVADGLYSTLEGSFSRRFWLGGRFDVVGLDADTAAGRTLGASVIGVFAPTEFSAYRLQAQRQFLPDGHTSDSLVGQLSFTLGAHPAHAY